MKNGIVIKSIILTVTLAISQVKAQSDSIFYTYDVKCEFFKAHETRDIKTGTIKLKRKLVEVEDVRSIIFLENDSLLINTFSSNVNDVSVLRIKDYSFWFVGLCVGMSLGGLAGSQIGAQYESSGGQLHFFEGVPTAIGAIIGAVAGGIAGTIIGANIYSYETLSLFKIPAKDKKAKLIKFLRKNK